MLSNDFQEGTLVGINKKEFGWIRHAEHGLIYWDFRRRRNVVLNEDSKPTFGAKSIHPSSSGICVGEKIVFTISEDTRGRIRVHKGARKSEWEYIEAVGQVLKRLLS